MQAHSHGAGAPARTKAAALRSTRVTDFPVPTGREEEWRFTPLARLRGLAGDAPEAEPGAGKVVVEADPAPEVVVTTAARGEDPRVGSVLVPYDRVAARAYAGWPSATVVTVPAGAVASRPTVVSLRGEGADEVSFGHVLVDVGPAAQATVILDHTGSAVYAGGVEVRVADGGVLTLVSVQDWADDAVHAGAQSARLGRDAQYTSIVVTLGGDLVRLTPDVLFAGPGAEATLLGLYFADAGQHLEHRILVDHAQPHCRSRVTYRGALQGHDAHTVWIGDVLIRHDAVGTDTYEVNRNLVLTDGARADSVPNLEIETGEVAGAGHASATGRFDDEQLFYLQSRGIAEGDARRMVVRAFFAGILDQIAVPDLRDRLSAAVDAELERARS